MEAEIDGNTGLICLLGNPVSHSLSPLMQNYALRKNNFNAVYLAFKVTQENLKTAIDGLKSLNFIGANVTIPFKVKIIPFLDKIDETTNKIGAVNTIVNKNGILWGYNTDGLAAVDLIKQEIGSLKDKQFLILGAGGVARAISYFIVKNKGKLLILNRTVKNAEILIKDLKKASSHKIHCELLLSDQLTTAIKNVDLVINATSVGMYPNHHVSPLDSKFLRKDLIVFDTVYTPLKTMLLKEAEKIGCTIIEGYKMLVRQGALSFKLWTATEPPILKMEELVYNKLKSVEGH